MNEQINVYLFNKEARPVLKTHSIEDVTDPTNPVPLAIQKPGNLVSFKSGITIRIVVHITAPDGTVLPVSQGFTLPLAGQLGSSPRIVDIEFIDGVAEVILQDWPSGRWRVSEDEINVDIANVEDHFNFDGLILKVRE